MKTLTIVSSRHLEKGVVPFTEFDRVRECVGHVTFSAKVVFGAHLAAGALLLQIKPKFCLPHGGARQAGEILTDKPWRVVVSEQTGKSWEWCRRATKVAEDLLLAIKGKRGKEIAQVREMLTAPDKVEWSIESYEILAKVVCEHFDVVTWNELLQEFGILPKQKLESGPSKKGKPKALPLTQRAGIFAQGFIRQLTPTNQTEYKKLLAALPVAPTGDEDEACLLDLQKVLEDRAAEVAETIERKMN